MFQVLCIGDLHYKIDNWEESLKLNQFILDQVKKLSPDLVVVLGDTLHSHRKLDTVLLNLAVDFFKELSQWSPVRVLIGNHDRINNTEYLTPVHPFVGFDLDKTIDTTLPKLQFIWKVEYEVIKGFKIGMVPYVYPGRLKEALATQFVVDQTIDSDKISIIDLDLVVAHQEIKGVKMNTVISKIGDVWPENYPLLVSGHIHQYQRIGKQVVYPGTPRMTDFGDTLDKSISLFKLTKDTGKIGMEYTSNGVGWVEERIFVPLAKKITLRINFDQIETSIDRVKTEMPGRIQIVATKEEISTLKVNPVINEWKSNGIKIQPILKRETMKIQAIKLKQSFLDQVYSVLSPEYTSHLKEILNS